MLCLYLQLDGLLYCCRSEWNVGACQVGKRHIWCYFQAQSVVGSCFIWVHFDSDDNRMILYWEYHCHVWSGCNNFERIPHFLLDHRTCWPPLWGVVPLWCHGPLMFQRSWTVNITFGVESLSGKAEQRFRIGLNQVSQDVQLFEDVPK